MDGQQGALEFDGATYESEFDRERLTRQLLRVYMLMKDGQWRTLAEIETATGDHQASVSARLRDLRKRKFGDHTVNRRTRGIRVRGLFEYQLIVNVTESERQEVAP